MKKKPARACTINAPCKINLHLRIGEKRPDGFHSLESIFASLALADTLRFDCAGKEGDSVLSTNWEIPQHECPEEPIPPEKNLVLRAISLFRDRTGFNSALKIRLDKRIPTGSGLGGGSSDAASTLLALNSLISAPLPMEEIKTMAALLGSDVPFFLTGGAAFVSGRGELIESVKSPAGLWVVLLKPPFSSDTARAYRLLDEARAREKAKEAEESFSKEKTPSEALMGEELSKKALIRALEEAPEAWPFRNDFLPVLPGLIKGEQKTKAGIYMALLQAFREADACFAGLSGSGSCCFGVFSAKEAAKKAVKALSMQGNYARLTFFLAHKAKAVLEY